MSPSIHTAIRRGVAAALVLSVAACGRDEATAPETPAAGTVTVDASRGWAFLSLQTGEIVTPADPLRSTGWDIAFNGTSVRLNGGEGGAAGVTGFCLCQNSATNPAPAQIKALTAASELPDFEVVGASSIPAAGAFTGDHLEPAIADWHTGSGAAATPSGDAWLVRLRDSVAYAKLRIAGIQGPTAATPGRVTLEFATQASTTAPLGATRTLAVDVPASGAVRVDLVDGATTTSPTAWDLEFEGWTLRVNGGASGRGKVAVYEIDTPFDQVTDAYAGDPRAYSRTDAYAGIFAAEPWYYYDFTDHTIWPVYDVYLVRRGDRVYKLQLTDYYGPAGEMRHVSLRYEQIAG